MKTISVLALLLLGTGTAFSQYRKTVSSKGVEQTDHSKKIEVEGTGHTLNYTLEGGVAHVEGAENTVNIKGSAKSISVSGTGNKVYIDKVDRVTLEGAGNTVYYRSSGTKTGKPATSLTGVDNKVVKQ